VQRFLSCDLGMHCPTASSVITMHVVMLLVKSKQAEIPTLYDENIDFIIDS